LKPDYFLSSRKQDLEKVQGKACFGFAFLLNKAKVVNVAAKTRGRAVQVRNSGTEGEGAAEAEGFGDELGFGL